MTRKKKLRRSKLTLRELKRRKRRSPWPRFSWASFKETVLWKYLLTIVVLIVLLLFSIDRARLSHSEDTSSQGKVFELPVVAEPNLDKPWSFFHPVWETLDYSHDARLGLNPSVGDDLKPFLNDPDGRIEKEFRVPFEMRDRVLFWMLIHARYPNETRLYHDRKDPGLIYGFADYSSLFKTSENKIQAYQKIAQIEKQILKLLKEKIAEAGSLSQSKSLDLKDKNSFRAWLGRRGVHTPDQFYEKIQGIRTQTGQKDEFLNALHRSEQMLPYIESVLRKENLPVALGRIPFVESAFNPKAESKVGAVGMWQFMPETARQMIHPDSKQAWADPLKQTRSAAKILKIFRSLLPDWSTAVTSYNSGVGRLKRLVQKHKAKDIVGIIDNPEEDALGFAGKNFYAQFLSVNIVEAYRKEIFREESVPARVEVPEVAVQDKKFSNQFR